MQKARWLSLLWLLLGGALESRAQGLLCPPGVGFSHFTVRHHLGLAPLRYSSSRSLFLWGTYGPAGVAPYPVYGLPINRVTLFYYAAPPPVVVAPPRREDLDEEDPLLLPPLPRQPAVPFPGLPGAVFPGAPASVFRPLRPEDRARALLPALPDPPPPREPPAPKRPLAPRGSQPRLPPAEPPPLPRPPGPEADPKAENARLTALGKDAFAAREYGRAARRFRQASEVYPEESLAHFLLAQAEFSLGRYAEAVAAIRDGMRWRPDWPRVPFRAVGPYGANAADFRGHLRDLEAALARYPNDAVLLFLLAYQMWFDGRQDEARPLFQRAAALGMDRQTIDRFLRARPGDTVVVK